MKFKHYNELNSKKRLSNGRPYISICPASGVVRFFTAAVSGLKLEEGTKVEFLQSEIENKDWYIRVNSPEGFQLKNLQEARHFKSGALSLQRALMEASCVIQYLQSFFQLRFRLLQRWILMQTLMQY